MTKVDVPKKNYLILIGTIILIICACLAFYNVYNIYQENKIKVSPLSNKEVLYEEIKNATKEIDADTFLVVSYVEDRDIYENELEIKKYLNKNNLLENVMYLNVTDYKDEEDFIEDLNKVLKVNKDKKINNVPALVYYREGEIASIIDSSDHLLNKGDFEHIVDMYDLAS